MKTILGVIFVVVFAALTGLSLAHPGGADGAFVGLVGLVLTVVVVWRERFPNGLSYVLITLGVLRAVFPVTACVPFGYGPSLRSPHLYTAYLPWDCEITVRPLAEMTAVQAIVLIGVGAWWLWWRKVGARSPSGPAGLGGRECRRGDPLVSMPSSERVMSQEDARLADAGARKLFDKPLGDLLDDFERVGKAPTWELLETLIEVGREVSKAKATL